MKHRAHRITVVIALAAAALALLSGTSQAAVSSTIHAYFDADGHLMFTYLDGTQVSGTIPPGTYTVIYDNLGADDLAVDHAFHLSGPGINFAPPATVVQSTFSVTFTANSSYTLQDDLHPNLERRTFVASTSGGGSDTPTVGDADHDDEVDHEGRLERHRRRRPRQSGQAAAARDADRRDQRHREADAALQGQGRRASSRPASTSSRSSTRRRSSRSRCSASRRTR